MVSAVPFPAWTPGLGARSGNSLGLGKVVEDDTHRHGLFTYISVAHPPRRIRRGGHGHEPGNQGLLLLGLGKRLRRPRRQRGLGDQGGPEIDRRKGVVQRCPRRNGVGQDSGQQVLLPGQILQPGGLIVDEYDLGKLDYPQLGELRELGGRRTRL